MSPEKKDGPRDWDRELAEIDKLIAQNPVPAAVPEKRGTEAPGHRGTGAGAPSSGAPVPRSPGAPSGRYSRLFTWARLTLGVALGVGMTQWPYTHGCGLPLAAYLAGVATVIVAAVWSSVSSWRTRSGFAHFLSIALLLWGGALAAREVLPRVGYAKDPASWQCVTSVTTAWDSGIVGWRDGKGAAATVFSIPLSPYPPIPRLLIS